MVAQNGRFAQHEIDFFSCYGRTYPSKTVLEHRWCYNGDNRIYVVVCRVHEPVILSLQSLMWIFHSLLSKLSVYWYNLPVAAKW